MSSDPPSASFYEGVGFPDGTERNLRLTSAGIFRTRAENKKKFRILCSWDTVLRHKINSEGSGSPKLKLTLRVESPSDAFDDDSEDEVEIFLLKFQNREDLVRIKQDITHFRKQEQQEQNAATPQNQLFVMDESLQRANEQTRRNAEDESFHSESMRLSASNNNNHPTDSVRRNPPEPLHEQAEDVDTKSNSDEAEALIVANAVPVPPGGGTLQVETFQEEPDVELALHAEVDDNIGNGAYDPLEDPAMWAITYQQLLELEQLALDSLGRTKLAKATMRDINKVILRPTCDQNGKSYALTHNPNGLMLDAFVTHAWDEPFQAFVDSIREVFQTTIKKPNLWICATALFQGDAAAIKAQVGTQDDSMEDSAFVRALSKASMYVVVRNSSVDLYSRIWCIAELLQSKKMGLIPDKAFVTGPDDFSHLKSSCLDAQAFDARDRDKILRILLTQHNREEIDEFVQQFRAFEPPRSQKREHGLVLGMSPVVVAMCLAACVIILLVAIIVGVVVGTRGGGDDGSQSTTITPLGSPSPSTPMPTPPQTQPSIDFGGSPTPLPTPMPTLPPTPMPTLPPPTPPPTPQPTTPDPLVFELPDFTRAEMQSETSPQSRAFQWLKDENNLDEMQFWKQLQRFSLMTFYYSFDFENRRDWGKPLDECLWDDNEQIVCVPKTGSTSGNADRVGELVLVGSTNPQQRQLQTLPTPVGPKDGDIICVEGYVMDKFCIDRGTLLDNPSVRTLEEPEKHSVHCLVDVSVCYNTPFHVLEDGSPYGTGWQVDDNSKLMDLARSVGSCSTCTGDGDLQAGFRAVVRGQVTSADQKLLSVQQVGLRAAELCADVTVDLTATTVTSTLAPTNVQTAQSTTPPPLATVAPTVMPSTLSTAAGTTPPPLATLAPTNVQPTQSTTMPLEVSMLTSLQKLGFSAMNLETDISKMIPAETLAKLTGLKLLSFESTALNGRIPSTIGLLTTLEQFTLSDNYVRGPVPSELARLTNLKRLDLRNNLFTGQIPSELEILGTSLEEFDISGNGFTGTLPEDLATLAGLRSGSPLYVKFQYGFESDADIPTGCGGEDSEAFNDVMHQTGVFLQDFLRNKTDESLRFWLREVGWRSDTQAPAFPFEVAFDANFTSISGGQIRKEAIFTMLNKISTADIVVYIEDYLWSMPSPGPWASVDAVNITTDMGLEMPDSDFFNPCPDTTSAPTNQCGATAAGSAETDCCPAPSAEVACTSEIRPVICGANNCEYSNSCLGEAAGFNDDECVEPGAPQPLESSPPPTPLPTLPPTWRPAGACNTPACRQQIDYTASNTVVGAGNS